MRELNLAEMEDVSGAYSWNWGSAGGFLTSLAKNTVELAKSVIVGAATAGAAGAIIGGKHGGDGGGLLGFGAIGQGVGMIGGGLIGMVAGGAAAAAAGWDLTLEYSEKAAEGMINGSI